MTAPVAVAAVANLSISIGPGAGSALQGEITGCDHTDVTAGIALTVVAAVTNLRIHIVAAAATGIQ